MSNVDLLTQKLPPVVPITIGDTVFNLKRWNVSDRIGWLKSLKGEGISADSAALALVYSVCDDDGNLLLKPEQLPDLVASNNPYAAPVLSAILELNGLTEKAVGEKKAP